MSGIEALLLSQVIVIGGVEGQVVTKQADGSLALEDAPGGAESPLTLTANSATETPLTIQGAASQTGNLTEWKDSAGVTQSWIDSSQNLVLRSAGIISFGSTAHSPYIQALSSGRVINFFVGSNKENHHQIDQRGLVVGVQSAGIGPQCGVIGQINRSRTVLIEGSSSSADSIAIGGVDIKAGVYTGGTNANGANVTIEPSLGIGTGTQGQLIFNNIPMADPVVAGAIWNDGGTLKISAG